MPRPFCRNTGACLASWHVPARRAVGINATDCSTGLNASIH